VPLIKAAGGIVVRDGRVLVVHRPTYDDWSLPKGKLEPGESWQDAARREVEEETGLRGEVGPEVGRTRYEVDGAPKEVRYFALEAGGEARAQHEVDEVRWVTAAEAEALLTQPNDRRLVREALKTRAG
jgi:8-oxo-dGTP diphosphatase